MPLVGPRKRPKSASYRASRSRRPRRRNLRKCSACSRLLPIHLNKCSCGHSRISSLKIGRVHSGSLDSESSSNGCRSVRRAYRPSSGTSGISSKGGESTTLTSEREENSDEQVSSILIKATQPDISVEPPSECEKTEDGGEEE